MLGPELMPVAEVVKTMMKSIGGNCMAARPRAEVLNHCRRHVDRFCQYKSPGPNPGNFYLIGLGSQLGIWIFKTSPGGLARAENPVLEAYRKRGQR